MSDAKRGEAWKALAVGSVTLSEREPYYGSCGCYDSSCKACVRAEEDTRKEYAEHGYEAGRSDGLEEAARWVESRASIPKTRDGMVALATRIRALVKA